MVYIAQKKQQSERIRECHNFLKTYQKFPSRRVTRSNYIEANVIISFLNSRDTAHTRALKVFDHEDKK